MNREPYDGFTVQWKQTTQLTVGRDTIDIYDIKPPHTTNGRAVVLVGGWGGTPEMYKDNIVTLARLGRRVVAIKAPHGIEYTLPHGSNGLSEAQVRRIGALFAALEEKQLKLVDAIGHSAGCLDLIMAARLREHRFHSLVLVDPAGLLRADRPWRLGARFLADAIASCADSARRSVLRRRLLLATREIIDSFLHNPRAALWEIGSISRARVGQMLRQLKLEGVRICIIHAVGDGAFPMRRVQHIVRPAMVHGFLSVKGRHGQFQLEADRYTRLADCALAAMHD